MESQVYRAQICTEVNTYFHRLATQGKLTQVGLGTVFLGTGARARLHLQVASTCEPVWLPIASLCSRVRISKIAMI